MLRRHSARLLKMVNSLLDFSQIEAGRLDAVFEPTDLAAFTTDLTSLFHSAVDRAGLALTVDCPPLAEPVYVDRGLWEKIVLNLVSNAVKFTFEGGIDVRLRETDAMVELTVTDTGIGIAAADIPHLFRHFHRVRGTRARSQEGSGIGLRARVRARTIPRRQRHRRQRARSWQHLQRPPAEGPCASAR